MHSSSSDTAFHCKACELVDTDEMVQCDTCDDWYHFTCVGVNEEIHSEDWNCSKCQPLGTPSVAASENQTNQPKEPLVAATEIQANKPKDPPATSKSVTLQPPSKSSYRPEQHLNVSTGRKAERTSRSKLRELQLQQLQEEKEMRERSDREFLEKKYALLRELASDSSETESDYGNSELDNNNQTQNKPVFYPTTHNSTPVQQNGVKFKRSFTTVNDPNPQIPQSSNPNNPNNHNASSDRLPTAYYSLNGTSIETSVPNKQQMAARQVMVKDQVTFSGRPEEWPLFISWFNSTTTSCGFTNTDNLRRLQNCLKGEALDAVRNRLLLPDQVPGVLNTLKIHFGQPEVIIDNLVERIRKEPPPRQDKLQTIIKFSLAVQNICGVMEATGLHAYLENPSLLKELTNKLPPPIRLEWGSYRKNLSVVNLSAYSAWLEEVAHSASIVNPLHELQSSSASQGRNIRASVNVHQDSQTQHQQNIRDCLLCTSNCKSIDQCETFLKMNLKDRWNIVKRHTVCRTCLRQHGRNPCYLRKVCGVDGCNIKHHQLLHKQRETSNTTGTLSHHKSKEQVLFRIVPVTLHHEQKKLNTFAFLDDGSSLSLLDEKLAMELGVEGTPQPLCLKWTSNHQRTEQSSRKINIHISSSSPLKRYNLSNIRTVQSLELPKQTINSKELSNRYEHLKGIPIESYTNAQPRVLLGLDNWKLSVPLQTREGEENQPVAAKTRLGWTVYGPHTLANDRSDRRIHFLNFHTCDCQRLDESDLNTQLKEYIALESIGTKSFKVLRSHDDEKAITTMKNEAVVEGNKYIVPLLWKFNSKQMPDNRSMAEKRLKCLERRMEKDSELNENLHKQIDEYVKKGYARKLSESELSQNCFPIWYLPIFPVRNHNKPNKVRIVWDAAAAVDGISLNSMLLSGPDIVPSLLSVLFRFRQNKIAICADIKEMFHQVGIKKSDQHAQRFLWFRNGNGSKKMEEYVMQVMTFGSTCSPFCAQFVKNENAKKFEHQFPRAVRAIIENHYVDDYLDSVESEEEAIQLSNEVISIHNKAGFHIRNFMSNSPEVLKDLKGRAANFAENTSNWHILSGTEKILGMWWSPKDDSFSFAIRAHTINFDVLNEDVWPTKREILKVLMSVFDPLGLIANVMVLLKIILQEVWTSAVEWDEQILPQQLQKWKKWKSLIPSIKDISIQRSYLKGHPFNKDSDVEVHIFVDASEVAYSAVCYIRVTNRNFISCSLVAAKTKIAPMKVISIPRLELEAAVLGTRLAKTVVEGHSIDIKEKYFWSDSKTVLSWINSDHRKYKQFVAFRIGEILEDTDRKSWRWVPSKENVADEATKWQFKGEFNSNSRWYNGPQFLYEAKENWPVEFTQSEATDAELRHIHLHQEETIPDLFDIERFGKWNKILRSMAQVYRWFRMYSEQRRKENVIRCLTNQDFKKAENYLYRTCQRDVFAEEIAVLNHVENRADQKIANLEKSSALYKLSPYLDENMVLRMHGRIDAAAGVPLSTRRPIILPKQHPITRLIVSDYHERFHHHNNETVVNELRQKFNIPRLRVLLRSIQRSCQKCKITRCLPNPPLMGDLPAARLQAFVKPFSYIGIDYFGPLHVKVGRHLEKRWGVLITCLTVRAVHVEIACTLSADSCIMALKRFIARRGWPLEIYSDNGTNFRGASKELKEAMQNLDINKIAENFVGPNIKWNFNPPLTPHMGGSWERLVRSVKQTLSHISPMRNPSEELLSTMLSEVERILNSRPLTYVPLDGGDAEALTPNHFLLGSSSGEKLPGPIYSDGVALRKGWLTSEQFANQFWRRWVREYLPDLTRRTKWYSSTRSIQEGDVVIITDPDSPRNSWPKGIILKVLPGKDGVVRSAIVKTKTGIYTRAAAKIAVLDVGRIEEDGKLIQGTSLPGGSVTDTGNTIR